MRATGRRIKSDLTAKNDVDAFVWLCRLFHVDHFQAFLPTQSLSFPVVLTVFEVVNIGGIESQRACRHSHN